MLKLETGEWSNNKEEIGGAFISRFKETFQTSAPIIPDDLENLVVPCITPEENVLLCAVPSEEEIKKIIFQFGPTKAPGPDGFIKPERGLRQGDPISPFLFIICAEVLSRILNRAVANGNFKGIKVGGAGPVISHLLFADDLVVFGQAKADEARAILSCLNLYGLWSGQTINFEKSSIHFSKNVMNRDAAPLARSVGLRRARRGLKYLGLPLIFNGPRTQVFGDVIERVQSRLKGWKAKVLSQAARGLLIKTVAQAIPSYVMSTFLLPKTTCEKLDGLFRRFWWGFKDGQRGLCLKSWDSICLPKSSGGLGLRRMWDHNKALIAKLSWAMVENEDRLWVSVLRNKYIRRGEVLNHKCNNGASWIWQGICKGMELIKKGACIMIGSGQNVDFWNDPWIPWLDDFVPRPNPILQARPIFSEVSDLFSPDGMSWNNLLLQSLFDEESCEAIGKIHLPINRVGNQIIWTPNANGQFSVKSAYLTDQRVRLGASNGFLPKEWLSLWGTRMHERHKLFLWKVAWNILPSKEVLAVRFEIIDKLCPLCSCSSESLSHLFLECSVARVLWRLSAWPIQLAALAHLSSATLVKILVEDSASLGVPIEERDKFVLFVGVLLKQLWTLRNLVIHHNYKVDILRWKVRVDAMVEEHFSAQASSRKIRDLQLWSAPPKGWIKCNVDVAMKAQFSTLAMVSRDSSHKIVLVKIWKLAPQDPTMAEAQAIYHAIKEAAELEWDSVIFESDSLLSANPLQDWNCPPVWAIRNGC